jgi:hypothetical protein
VFAILVSLIFGIQIGKSVTSQPLWTLNGPPIPVADQYVGIFPNGTYYVESGDWQTTSVFSDGGSALEAAVSNGGYIIVTSGDFYFANAKFLSIKTGTTIIGRNIGNIEGQGSSGSNNGTRFLFETDKTLISFANTLNQVTESCTLENIKIEFTGTKLTHPIIYGEDLCYSTFRNVYVNAQGANCTIMKILGVRYFCVDNLWDHIILRGAIGGTGISLQANKGSWNNENRIRDSRIWNCGKGVVFGGEGDKDAGEVDLNKVQATSFDTTTIAGIVNNGKWNGFSICDFVDTRSGNTYVGTPGSTNTTLIGCSGMSNADGIVNNGAYLTIVGG